MYDVFLNMRESNEAIKSLNTPLCELVRAYRIFKSNDTNQALSVIVVVYILGCVVSDILRYVLGSSSTILDSPIEAVSFSTGFVAIVLFVVSVVHRFFHKHHKHHAYPPDAADPAERAGPVTLLQRLRGVCLGVDQSSKALRVVNDGLVVFLTLFTGLAAVGRVLHGLPNPSQYAPNDTPNGLQNGSPNGAQYGTQYGTQNGAPYGPSSYGTSQYSSSQHGSSHGSSLSVAVWGSEEGGVNTLETYALCLYVVLLPQLFCKGASRTAICLSW
jgi:hypothetical protein